MVPEVVYSIRGYYFPAGKYVLGGQQAAVVLQGHGQNSRPGSGSYDPDFWLDPSSSHLVRSGSGLFKESGPDFWLYPDPFLWMYPDPVF